MGALAISTLVLLPQGNYDDLVGRRVHLVQHAVVPACPYTKLVRLAGYYVIPARTRVLPQFQYRAHHAHEVIVLKLE